MWNVTLRVCLSSGSLSFFSRAKVTSTTQCKTCSILNFDWVNLVFAALSLIFRGHEPGLLQAYWVIISCGLCFCTRCPWQDLISDAVVKCFISFDLCLLRLNKDFSFFWPSGAISGQKKCFGSFGSQFGLNTREAWAPSPSPLYANGCYSDAIYITVSFDFHHLWLITTTIRSVDFSGQFLVEKWMCK